MDGLTTSRVARWDFTFPKSPWRIDSTRIESRIFPREPFSSTQFAHRSRASVGAQRTFRLTKLPSPPTRTRSTIPCPSIPPLSLFHHMRIPPSWQVSALLLDTGQSIRYTSRCWRLGVSGGIIEPIPSVAWQKDGGGHFPP